MTTTGSMKRRKFSEEQIINVLREADSETREQASEAKTL